MSEIEGQSITTAGSFAAAKTPAAISIFGATGDLTKRKLVPALFNLFLDGLLPASFTVIGVARRDLDREEFVNSLLEGVEQFSRRQPVDKSKWEEFAKNLDYQSLAFDDAVDYEKLAERLRSADAKQESPCNRLFYFATSPEYFGTISQQLKAADLLEERQFNEHKRSSRIIIEKPFGHDLESARALNRTLLACMQESQIYRIDHYLGKETVQNLMVFRFANGIFEPIWNHKYISHIELSVCEAVGVENRASYFDQAGILRDIVQNHALQLLALVGLEPPVAFEADAVRDEKVKVLRALKRISATNVSRKVVRGRYQKGFIAGKAVEGYLAEPGVSPQSMTETYVALELEIDNWRWSGVPIYLRAGKRLPKRVTEISIYFRSVPHVLFNRMASPIGRLSIADNSSAASKVVSNEPRVAPNVLSFRIQPDEGISLKICAKPPGPIVRVQPVKMEFSYGTSFGAQAPEAYERLILDCMKGDATLFTRNDEIEEAWSYLSPIFDAWQNKGASSVPIFGYDAGTWGPKAADELIQRRTGHSWRQL